MSAPAWLASPPADAAIEIAEEAVTVAVLGSHGGDTLVERFAVEPLPPGALVPSLTAASLVNRDAVARALAAAVDQLGVRPRRVALVVPDPIARVSLLRFDRLPPRRDDLEQIIRWQLKKTAPFPVDDACLTFSPATGVNGGNSGSTGGELLVALARREAVREYESLAESIGAHAGLVDLSTLSVLNLYLSSTPPPVGDWLLVHMRPAYTSIAILRGADVIFFRTRGHDEQDSLSDLVHQTTMYYQDRLQGQGFAHVFLGGGGTPHDLDLARRDLDDRFGIPVEPIDATLRVTLTDRITVTAAVRAGLAPLAGVLLRARQEAVGA